MFLNPPFIIDGFNFKEDEILFCFLWVNEKVPEFCFVDEIDQFVLGFRILENEEDYGIESLRY